MNPSQVIKETLITHYAIDGDIENIETEVNIQLKHVLEVIRLPSSRPFRI